MRKPFIETGKIVTTHGVRGEVKVQPWCDDPAFLTQVGAFGVGDPANICRVEGARVHKGMVLLQLAGVETVEQAAALRGALLYVRREEIPLAKGEYLIQDLIGLQVFDADTGALYGSLCDVSKTGANDVYHIRFPDGAVRLIPMIPQVVLRVDTAAGRMDIRPLEGLFDL